MKIQALVAAVIPDAPGSAINPNELQDLIDAADWGGVNARSLESRAASFDDGVAGVPQARRTALTRACSRASASNSWQAPPARASAVASRSSNCQVCSDHPATSSLNRSTSSRKKSTWLAGHRSDSSTLVAPPVARDPVISSVMAAVSTHRHRP